MLNLLNACTMISNSRKFNLVQKGHHSKHSSRLFEESFIWCLQAWYWYWDPKSIFQLEPAECFQCNLLLMFKFKMKLRDTVSLVFNLFFVRMKALNCRETWSVWCDCFLPVAFDKQKCFANRQGDRMPSFNALPR